MIKDFSVRLPDIPTSIHSTLNQIWEKTWRLPLEETGLSLEHPRIGRRQRMRELEMASRKQRIPIGLDGRDLKEYLQTIRSGRLEIECQAEVAQCTGHAAAPLMDAREHESRPGLSGIQLDGSASRGLGAVDVTDLDEALSAAEVSVDEVRVELEAPFERGARLHEAALQTGT